MLPTRPLPKPSGVRQGAAGVGEVSSPHARIPLSASGVSRATRDYASRVTLPRDAGATDLAARRLWAMQDAAQRLTPHRYALDRDGEPIPIPGGEGFAPSAIRKCRRVRVSHEVHVSVLDGRASLEGLATCRSVWECPCCSRRVRSERASVVRQVVQFWRNLGGECYLATFTIKHGFSDRLGETFDGIARAWQAMQRGKSWQTWTAQGIESCRSLEVTHGKNGWHPHVHAVFFAPKKLDENATSAWLTERWKRAVRKELGEAFEPHADSEGVERGTDFRLLEVDDYIVKIGAELTDPTGAKRAKKGNRTPWEILESASIGQAEDTWLWREYATAAKGRRFLTWTRGLKGMKEAAEHQLLVDLKDERSASVHVDTLSPREWDSLRDLPDFRCELLLAACAGKAAVLEVLREFKELRSHRIREGLRSSDPPDE